MDRAAGQGLNARPGNSQTWTPFNLLLYSLIYDVLQVSYFSVSINYNDHQQDDLVYTQLMLFRRLILYSIN